MANHSGELQHSRQILSYWTSERIQSAQPESDPEYDTSSMSEKDMTSAILSYWSPERLASAQPETMAYGKHIEEREASIRDVASESDRTQKVTVQAAGSLRIVPDDTVRKFPYQSVGKLFYTKVSPSGPSRDSYASAWVVNASSQLHVIMTAAHCLKRGAETATNILFIPGFIPPNAKLFGSYPQIPGGEGVAWSVDPNWDPNNMQSRYDLGIIKLSVDPDTRKYVDDVVIPIQMLSNQQYSSRSEWNTIGYPIASSQNPDGKMVERSGTFYRMSSDGGAVYKYGTLPKGTSGGPWIYTGSDGRSNGIQAGNVDEAGGCAVSTYFKSTAEELVKAHFR